jgi:hypothetical protein
MHEHYVERTESGAGTATGVIVGILVVLFLGILALFLFFGGPGRFVGGTTIPSQPNTNVNVQPPGQSQPSGPNINVPRQIDINVNQPPAQQQPMQQQPQAPAQP